MRYILISTYWLFYNDWPRTYMGHNLCIISSIIDMKYYYIIIILKANANWLNFISCVILVGDKLWVISYFSVDNYIYFLSYRLTRAEINWSQDHYCKNTVTLLYLQFYSLLKSFVCSVHRDVQTSIFACADVSQNVAGCDVPLGNHIVWLQSVLPAKEFIRSDIKALW